MDEIYSKRLLLKVISKSDLLQIHKLHLLAETNLFNTLGIPNSLAESEAVVNRLIALNESVPRALFGFSVFLEKSNQFIGIAGITMGKEKYENGELWFKFHKDYWNQGFATETVNRLLSFGFKELKLHRMEAGCAVNNVASTRVLLKAGFKQEGIKRKHLPLETGWADCLEYGILSAEYAKIN